MKNLYIKEKVKLLLHLIKPNKKHNITYYPRIKCIFIGVPKCANSAINALLLKEEKNIEINFENIPYSEIHRQKAEYKITKKQLVEMVTTEILVFSVVRDPTERLISVFQNKVLDENSKLIKFGYPFFLWKNKNKFESFANLVCKLPDFLCERHFTSQSFYLDKIILDKTDFICSIDNFDYLKNRIAIHLNKESIDFPLVNKSKTKEHTITEHTLKKIKKRYKKDYFLLKSGKKHKEKLLFKFYQQKNFRDRFKPLSKISNKLKISAASNFKYVILKIHCIFNIKKIKKINILNKNAYIDISDPEAINLFLFSILSKNEDPLSTFLIKNLKKDDVLYDVGANYGFFTALAKNFISDGNIYSFEPNPDVFRCTKLLESENTFVKNIALSDSQNKNAEMFISTKGSGKSSLISNVQEEFHKKITVHSVKLDEFIKKNIAPTLIKIDVEGSEYNVISGGKKFLKKFNGIILMEVWSGEKGRKFSKKAVNLLYGLGYKSYMIKNDGSIRYSKIIFDKKPIDYENYVFKK